MNTEFPKYNQILNGHRHPVQELTRRQANDQRYRNVIARRAAETAANSEVAATELVGTEALLVANPLVPRSEAAWELGISERSLANMRPPTTLVKGRAYVDIGQLRQMIADSVSSPMKEREASERAAASPVRHSRYVSTSSWVLVSSRQKPALTPRICQKYCI